jgi:hypothetical protein
METVIIELTQFPLRFPTGAELANNVIYNGILCMWGGEGDTFIVVDCRFGHYLGCS